MVKELWVNLPVKDIKRSKQFFTAIGFSFNTKHGDSDHSASLMIGSKNMIVMLFEDSMFGSFVGHSIADTTKGNEVLLSFDGESRAEVDEMAEKVKAAGGKIFSEPADHQGWMYGFGFSDLDGHRWNMLYMDMSKMQR